MRIILTLLSLVVTMTAFGNDRSNEELIRRTSEIARERKSYLIFFTNSVHGAGKTRKMMLDTFYPDYRGVNF